MTPLKVRQLMQVLANLPPDAPVVVALGGLLATPVVAVQPKEWVDNLEKDNGELAALLHTENTYEQPEPPLVMKD